MKKIVAFSLAVLSLAAVSCRRGELAPQRPTDAVQFSVAMNTFDVKATDNAFEAGDAVGIFAGAPMNAANVKGTISGTTLTPATEIKWAENQTASTQFAAYLPYDAARSAATFNFAVKADQSAYADYQASDLLASAVTAAPRTTVAFAMKHQLTKLIVIPTCEDAAETVTGVTIQELVTEASVDLMAGTIAAGTAKGAVKAGAAVAGNGGQGFAAILVPQTVQLKLTVTTSAGRSVEYALADAKALASGKAYKAEITVKKAGVEPGPETPVEFTISIIDWEAGEDLSFVNPDEANPNEGKWSVIGKLNGTDWDTDFWMEETSEGVWEADITYAEGDSFKLRQDGKWSSETETHAEAGMPAEAEGTVPVDGTEYGLWGSNNKDITLAAAGEYHLKFVVDGYKFYVTSNAAPAGPEVNELYLLGDACDAGWSLDLMEAFTKEGKVFTLTANLQANKEFRFMAVKQSNTWWPAIVQEIETGKPVYCADQADWDAHNTVYKHFSVAETGSYEIVVDVDAWTVTLTRKGDVVAPVVTINELYIIGEAVANTWSLDAAEQLTKNGDVFTITTHLDANEIFRFICQKDWYPALVKGDTEGTVRYVNSATDPDHFTVAQSGTYLITIDVAAMTITFALQEADPEPAPSTWYVIGDVYTDDDTVVAWSTDFPMTEAEGVWSITINVRSEFKLRAYPEGTADDAKWNTQLGMWASDTNTYMDVANTYGLATTAQGNKNIAFAEAGQYKLELNGTTLSATKL